MSGADDPADELIDIVDEHDEVIGVVTRGEMRAKRLRHRAVFIAVQNSAGRLLAHRRSLDKDVCPGAWDIAFGGVVGAGESYVQAAVRELSEEAGITDAHLVEIGGGAFADRHFAVIGRCYHVVHDGSVSFDDGEVIEARWVGRAELDALLREHDVMPDSVALVLDHLDVAD